MEPLFKRGDFWCRFSYADDVLILRTGPNTAITTALLAADVQDALDWGASTAVTFEPEKCELLHFNKAGKQRDDQVRAGNFVVEPSRGPVRWLGAFFDPKLTFKAHVNTWCAKALRVANHLRSLNKTRKGAPPNSMALAASACVLPVALYAAEAWWPGKFKESNVVGGKVVSTQTASHVDKINSVVKAA
ncbi:hypothetical protein, partial [Actinomadura sp. RB99]|uniref:hypothetical protein n=1 Tax=Actinomadura sp. RB99 TaxID=2691577 RepID=UPI00168783A9